MRNQHPSITSPTMVLTDSIFLLAQPLSQFLDQSRAWFKNNNTCQCLLHFFPIGCYHNVSDSQSPWTFDLGHWWNSLPIGVVCVMKLFRYFSSLQISQLIKPILWFLLMHRSDTDSPRIVALILLRKHLLNECYICSTRNLLHLSEIEWIQH